MNRVVDKYLSIILVVYNRINLIRKTLLSINRQSVLPAEVIISDDGSIEDIPDGISDLIPGLNFSIKYVRQEDQGFRAAKCRNNGIHESSGDYLVFFDQDILCTKGYVKNFCDHRVKGQFLVAFPVLLSDEQTGQITESSIRDDSYTEIITKAQKHRMLNQYIKDTFYYYQRKIFLPGDIRPKLRSGVFGIYKSDILKVNGFDESYLGWGNEDDDLGRRLYRAGIVGKTSFRDEYPIHMYHPPHRVGQSRVNQDYYHKRIIEIRNGDYQAVNGISNPLGNYRPEVVNLK